MAHAKRQMVLRAFDTKKHCQLASGLSVHYLPESPMSLFSEVYVQVHPVQKGQWCLDYHTVRLWSTPLPLYNAGSKLGHKAAVLDSFSEWVNTQVSTAGPSSHPINLDR